MLQRRKGQKEELRPEFNIKHSIQNSNIENMASIFFNLMLNKKKENLTKTVKALSSAKTESLNDQFKTICDVIFMEYLKTYQ